ncbi:hypothetical protein ACS0TY_026632 [Phlomoides rotata]
MQNMHDLVMVSDDDCKDQLQMDRALFHKLCGLVRTFGGLKSSRNISVEEKYIFLVPAQSVDENTSDARWGKFQGCLGALDSRYIDVHVSATNKGQYCNRKGHCSVNVLRVCDMNMRFVYVLTGWEGSAVDSRVLRDAIHRNNGLHVPRGNYYLCDNGYPNCKGFLTPYKGVMYHLNEWSSRQPQTYQEYFNMKHTRARNMRWGILRSPSWYPIKTTNKIIVACCLLHNYIKREIIDAHGSGIALNVDKGKAVRAQDALIRCLIDIVNDGWKAENGFKAGFQRELEKNMRKMLPVTDIVVNPHINSKIHVWKKEYGALSDLLSKSGIRWNSTTSMIEVSDEEVWDASRQADPHLKSMCFKSWPYYSQWLEIFGKDRATGENAVDPLDLFQELMWVDLDQAGETGDKYIP